jgi:hypothetical protein
MEIFQRRTCNGLVAEEFIEELNQLVNSSLIYEVDGYYLMHGTGELVKHRKEANIRAAGLMEKAKKNAKLISAFPFVRAVFLSGSISKGDADSKADIDYFIITSINRLWIVRSLLTIYKKIFLLNSYKYFCLNYFIDQSDYCIKDRNIFTATELINLIPLYGVEEFKKLNDSNKWVSSYYPFLPQPSTASTMTGKGRKLKRILEVSLKNKLGDFVDTSLMKITVLVLNYKLKRLNKMHEEALDPEIRFEKHCCKYHRNSFQRKVLNSYNFKIKEFEDKHQLSLTRRNG